MQKHTRYRLYLLHIQSMIHLLVSLSMINECAEEVTRVTKWHIHGKRLTLIYYEMCQTCDHVYRFIFSTISQNMKKTYMSIVQICLWMLWLASNTISPEALAMCTPSYTVSFSDTVLCVSSPRAMNKQRHTLNTRTGQELAGMQVSLCTTALQGEAYVVHTHHVVAEINELININQNKWLLGSWNVSFLVPSGPVRPTPAWPIPHGGMPFTLARMQREVWCEFDMGSGGSVTRAHIKPRAKHLCHAYKPRGTGYRISITSVEWSVWFIV